MSKLFCKVCGKKSDSDYCFFHKPKKSILKKVKVSVEEKSSMHNFFLSIWKKRIHESEISGEYLGKEPLSVYFHHILPKNKYPEAAFDEKNIILMTLNEHSNVENNIYKYEKINKLREYLKNKYDIL